MADGMLSLAWNNHSTTFCHMLSNLREMEKYTDATVACEGKFYGVHKLVLASCSDYFFKMFEETPCKHPVVVLKDIHGKEIEALLSYMYDGVVSVAQSDLARLINAAEVLQIKGLAVPDEPPKARKKVSHLRSSSDDRTSPQLKRVRREVSSPSGNTRSRDKSLSGGREQVESRNGVNRVEAAANKTENLKETLEEIDIRRGSQDETEMKSDDPEIETISDESTIKEEVSIESDDLPETPFEFTSPNPDMDLESSSGMKDLVNLELPVGFSSSSDPYDPQAGPSGLQWSSAQGDMSNHGYSGDTASVAGPSGSQSQQDRSMVGLQNVEGNHDALRIRRPAKEGSYPVGGSSRRYKCTICDHSAPDSWHLSRHMRKHTGERPFSCPLCPMSFSTKSILTTHVRTHTGEKPYGCPLCSYRAVQKVSITYHMRKHNLDTFS